MCSWRSVSLARFVPHIDKASTTPTTPGKESFRLHDILRSRHPLSFRYILAQRLLQAAETVKINPSRHWLLGMRLVRLKGV